MPRPKASPNDPERRERITRGALAVIAAEGVHRATHRRIAAEAGVPLGSLTYYFDGLSHIIESAFELLVDDLSSIYRDALAGSSDLDEACRNFARLILSPDYLTEPRAGAMLQLYSYGNFNEHVHELRARWMRTSRQSLSEFFPAAAVASLDALFEGWTLHGFFDANALDPDEVLRVVRAVARAASR